jgi:hypothetical protein
VPNQSCNSLIVSSLKRLEDKVIVFRLGRWAFFKASIAWWEARWIVIIRVAVGLHEYLDTLIVEFIPRCIQCAKGRSLQLK